MKTYRYLKYGTFICSDRALVRRTCNRRIIVNWIGLGRDVPAFSSAYVEFHQHTNRTFDPYMPIVVIGALAGGVAFAVIYGLHSIPGQLAAAGAVCYALVIIIGAPTCVRINHQIRALVHSEPTARMGANPARWIRFHIIRTLFSLPGFAIYLIVVMSNTGHR
jgi:Domain of unknown function (DUF1772)